MKNFTRKVLILENLTSPYIHQAIIVLNEYNPANETKVISDAEKVVNQYLKKNGFIENDNTKTYLKNNKKRHTSAFPWVMGLISAVVLIAFSLIKFK